MSKYVHVRIPAKLVDDYKKENPEVQDLDYTHVVWVMLRKALEYNEKTREAR